MQVVGLFALLTLPAGSVAAAPIVTIAPASQISSTTAQVVGTVAPQGLDTAYRFEYIGDGLFDSNVAAGLDGFTDAARAGVGFLPASAGPAQLSPVILQGLLPGTRYHLRLVAENDDSPFGVGATAPEFSTLGGSPAPPLPVPCIGDSCQVLPPEPVDPPLGTMQAGPGNPKVRYRRYGSRPQRKRRQNGVNRQGKRKSVRSANEIKGAHR